MSYSTGVRHKEGVTQEGPMIEERLTEDLLARLLAAPNPDSYLGEGLTLQRSLADYLHELLAAKGLKRADVYRASGLNSTVVYDAFSGKSRLGRDNALMVAFGLGCSLRETQRLLKLAGAAERARPATTSCGASARKRFWARARCNKAMRNWLEVEREGRTWRWDLGRGECSTP